MSGPSPKINLSDSFQIACFESLPIACGKLTERLLIAIESFIILIEKPTNRDFESFQSFRKLSKLSQAVGMLSHSMPQSELFKLAGQIEAFESF